MKILQTLLFIFFFIFIHINVKAQAVVVPKDIQGRRLFTKNNVALQGSPYLYDTWAKGTVKLGSGLGYEGLNIKYDQIEDMVIFSLDEKEPQLFTNIVHEFSIQPPKNNTIEKERKFRGGYPAADGNSLTALYEVLADGKTQLLKKVTKTIVQEQAYNSATKTDIIKEIVKYYIATPEKLIKIKKDKKSVLAALADKATEVGNFINENKLSLKDDSDLAKIISFYNSLK